MKDFILSRLYQLINSSSRTHGFFKSVIGQFPRLKNISKKLLFQIAELNEDSRFNKNLPELVKSQKRAGLAFVFFMGLGDAMYLTPFFKACREEFPDTPIQAWVSDSRDSVNSPSVAELLQMDPNFDAVHLFHGEKKGHWWNYDISKAEIPDNFLKTPLLWTDSNEPRAKQMFERMGLDWRGRDLAPILYSPPEPTLKARGVLETLRKNGEKGLVFLHLDTRSSDYLYPWRDELASQLIADGWAVASFTPLKEKNDKVSLALPGENGFNLKDTISFFRFARSFAPEGRVYGICVQSMIWAIAAAFSMPALGLNIFFDPLNIGSYATPNINLLSTRKYENVEVKFLAKPGEFHAKKKLAGSSVIDYHYKAVLKYFNLMAENNL